MITIQGEHDEIRLHGVRKATLTKKAVLELCLRIDCALQPEGRWRLGPSAVNFLSSIREQVTTPKARLSKKQRDTTDEILMQASSGESLVFLDSQSLVELANLIRYARGDGRISSLEENVMVSLKRRLDEPATAVSQAEQAMTVSRKQWRIVEEIRQKARFGLPGEPPPIDPDGLVENEDPDGQPPERDEIAVDHARDWAIVGVDENEDW
jgi:hypothetical protein